MSLKGSVCELLSCTGTCACHQTVCACEELSAMRGAVFGWACRSVPMGPRPRVRGWGCRASARAASVGFLSCGRACVDELPAHVPGGPMPLATGLWVHTCMGTASVGSNAFELQCCCHGVQRGVVCSVHAACGAGAGIGQSRGAVEAMGMHSGPRSGVLGG
jgi:hypothetical protein